MAAITRGSLLVVLAAVPCACGGAAAQSAPVPKPAPQAVSSADAGAVAEAAPTWPDAMAGAMSSRGEPHGQPVPLPADARGRARWLVFVGTRDVAEAAWRVARASDGSTDVEPVDRWPVGVKVVGAVVEAGVAYVLLETVATLDQPAGLRGAWIEGRASPFEGEPLELGDVKDMADLAERVKHPPPVGSTDRNAVALLATLRAAGASTAMLARSMATQGVDLGVGWQSTFVQATGHVDGDAAPSSPLADRVLAIVRDAITTHACGADRCEAWGDHGHAVVHFEVQGGRWVVRGVVEDAVIARAAAGGSPPKTVDGSADAHVTEAALHARAQEVKRVLAEAPLTATGGTIGVGLTDLAPDVPVVAVREGACVRVFGVDAGVVRAEASEATWDAAFADADGDGRTDVALHMAGKRADGSAITWTQVFLAPPPSVQATSLASDPPSALAVIDAADAASAARAAAALPPRGVTHDDACRMLTSAATPAGFKRDAAPDARVLLFDEPSMPTWRPKIVTAAKISAEDVRGLGSDCADVVCNANRPYCASSDARASEHVWFGWRDGHLEIEGVARYRGE
jgi:hypothetical protein